jgi:hypothetical protein
VTPASTPRAERPEPESDGTSGRKRHAGASGGSSDGRPDGRAKVRAGARRLSAGLCALQALALFVICGFYGVGLAGGDIGDPARTVVLTVLIAVFGAALAGLAWAWWRGSEWTSTPTVVWSALLVPVAWGVLQSGLIAVGALLLAVALIGIVLALVSGTPRQTPGARAGP